MDKILDTFEKVWENPFVKSLVFLIIAIVAAALASFIVKKLFRLTNLDKKMSGSDGNGMAVKFIGKLVFLIVFLLFLPAVLGALGLDSISKPITDFASVFIDYIPNIIAAAILVFLGIFIGQMLSDVISTLLGKTKIDSLTDKMKNNRADSSENEGDGMSGSESTVKISKVIGTIVYCAVVLIAIVQALKVLNIETLSRPAIEIINTVFGAVPDIVLAVLVVALGVVIANIVCKLMQNLLTGLNVDGLTSKILAGKKTSFSLTNFIVNAVRVLIILFVLAEGVDILGLEVLSNIMGVIIGYLPLVIKAVLIALAAFIGANLLDSFSSKSMSGMKLPVKLIKMIIYVLAAFMILSQLKLAPTIVEFGFIIMLAALGVAFALAFGIGGRDFAKKTLDELKAGKSENDKNTNKDKSEDQSSNNEKKN